MAASDPIDILLVSAESNSAPSLLASLATLNVNVTQAHSYQKAQPKLLANNFALIIVHLPTQGVESLVLTEFVRASAHSPATPIIFLDNSHDTDISVEPIYAHGAIEYLMMPVSPVVLRAKAAVFIDLHRKTLEAEERVRGSEDRYYALLNSIDEGFCTIKVIFDEQGNAIDYLFLEANAIFEEQSGLHAVIGKTAREVVPGLESQWFELYGNVALTGDALRFVEESPSMGRWFDVYAFRIGEDTNSLVTIIFKDISAQKKSELGREHLLKQLQAAHTQMTDVFQKAPAFMCTVHGPQHVFKNVNERYFQLIGKRDVVGKTVSEGLPEIVEQGYVQALDEVYRTGKLFVANDEHVMLQRKMDAPLEERVLDFVYLPLKNVDENVYGILVHGIDITERKRAEDGLRRLATELTQSNQHKTEFLAILAHELRNPLAPIRNGLEVMRMTGDDPEVFGNVREMMQRQVDQMVRLIDDLLDIARISSGKLELKKERVTLDNIVRTAIDSSMPVINANKHAVTIDVPAIPILLDADPVRLTQVLGNLLTNAAKYTPSGGEISLSARIVEDDILIVVADNGIGIPAESLTNIFEMFTQVHGDNSNAKGGLGIGLSLVHQLVELHGGSVTVSSDGAGKGSTFIVRLPLSRHGQMGLINPEVNTSLLAVREQRSLRILVADDNVDAAQSLVNLFQLLGHKTHVVYDGVEAYQAAQYFVPDVAFLDIGMPGMNGHEVASAIKNNMAIAGIILIALTGWGTTLDRAASRAAGFDHHMTKPLDIGVVKKLLWEFV